MNYIIRRIDDRNLEDVFKIEGVCFKYCAFEKEEWLKLLRSDDIINLGVFDGEKLMGNISVSDTDERNVYHIMSIAVLPEYRNLGIASNTIFVF